jgi:FHA domain
MSGVNMAPREHINPYVGPRAFEAGEALYGRDRELLEFLDLLIAERIVVLYSPSGAGKTSLIQAALLPKLDKENFEVLPILRVNQETPPGTRRPPKANRYMLSVMLYLERSIPDQARLDELAVTDFSTYLDQRETSGSHNSQSVLIFDQFEEVLTLDSTDRKEKTAFFDQVGSALRDKTRWALFAIREEFLGPLDPYLRSIPTRLQTRFRLDLLGEAAALKAVQRPAESEHVTFTDAAATLLVNDLRQIQVQSPETKVERRAGPYVEPVQLQVVCQRLWDRLPAGASEITPEHVQSIGNVDTALSDYYAEKVGTIAGETRVKERTIREWFDRELITEQGFRGQVLQQPGRSRGLDNRAIWKLVDAHLVRGEQRLGATWFELAHDRLIAPVRKSNAEWYQANLSPLQVQADLWARNNRPDSMLLHAALLKQAEAWAEAHQDELATHESEFIKACREARAIVNRRRLRYLVVAALVVISLMVTRYLVLWNEHRAWAYMRDLRTGDTHRLAGAWVSVGRSVPEIENNVEVEFATVSRLHLLINKNGVAFDLRSLNGSARNAQFMYYGRDQQLEDNDILVLAGVAAFEYESIRYGKLQFWEPRLKEVKPPSAAWGIVIDGTKKRVHYLTAESTVLGIGTDGELALGVTGGQKPLLVVEQVSDGGSHFTITVEPPEGSLRAVFKEGDYTYVSCTVPIGTRIGMLNAHELRAAGKCELLLWRREYDESRPGNQPLSGIPFRFEDVWFEIIAFPKRPN